MLELSLRCALVSTVALLPACATHTPPAEHPCPPASSQPAASATPVAPDAAKAPSDNAAPLATTAPETAPAATEAVRAPNPRDTAAFNAWLAQHEHAKDLPLVVAHAFAGAQARNVVFAVSYASGEAALAATATVTLDGLLDDSVRGEEHALGFARDAVEAPWRLTQTKSRVRCWPGRGHAELSAAPCT